MPKISKFWSLFTRKNDHLDSQIDDLKKDFANIRADIEKLEAELKLEMERTEKELKELEIKGLKRRALSEINNCSVKVPKLEMSLLKERNGLATENNQLKSDVDGLNTVVNDLNKGMDEILYTYKSQSDKIGLTRYD